MRRIAQDLLTLCFAVAVGLAVSCLAGPLAAASATTSSPTAPAAAATSAPTSAAVEPTISLPGTTPTPAPAVATAPAASTSKTETTKTEPPAPGTIVSKNIEISKITSSGIVNGNIDVFFALKNTGKFDDALTGAEADVTDKVVIVTGAVGKEVESPAFHIDVPAGKSAALEAGQQALRLASVAKTVKDGDHIALYLHFRSAPNAKLDIIVHKK